LSVALFCGLRRGELRGLQWINVDFDNGVIRVERSWDPSRVRLTSKPAPAVVPSRWPSSSAVR
jgi:integrase